MLTYRKIQLSDSRSLFALFKNNKKVEFFDPFDLDEKTVMKIIKPSKNLYYGIFSKSKMIGFGMLRWWKDYNCPTLGLLIDRNYRGQGLGKEMYLFLFAKAREQGCKKIVSIIHKKDVVSCHITEKLGMEKVKKPILTGEYDFTEYVKANKEKIILVKNL